MVRFVHPHHGSVRKCPEGFSWTNFFFGAFVPLSRGMYGNALVQAMFAVITLGFSHWVFAFMINRQYANHLLEEGFLPSSSDDIQKLTLMNVFVDPRFELSQTLPTEPQSVSTVSTSEQKAA